METTWTELNTLLLTTPRAGAVRGLLVRIFSGLLSLLRRGSRESLQRFARAADGVARKLAVSPEATDTELRYWYGGQCHAIAAICRTALSEQLSNETMRLVRTRAHWRNILVSLRGRETTQADLARELEIDPSFLGKTLRELEERGLITSEKQGNRWIRLLPAGELAAIEDADPDQETPSLLGDVAAAVLIAAEMAPAQQITEIPQLLKMARIALNAAEEAAHHLDGRHVQLSSGGVIVEPEPVMPPLPSRPPLATI